MECQDLFSLKNKKKNKKLSSAAVVISALRVLKSLLGTSPLAMDPKLLHAHTDSQADLRIPWVFMS